MWPLNLFKKQPVLKHSAVNPIKGDRPVIGLTPTQKQILLGHSFKRSLDNFTTTAPSGGQATTATDALGGTNASGVKGAHSFDLSVPDEIFSYYARRGFIGYQACAILKQHELIDKVCTMPCQDAMAPDYFLKLADNGADSDLNRDGATNKLDEDELTRAKRESDKHFKIKDKCIEFSVNCRTFGVAYAVPVVDGINYEYPFNLDGVTKGSYRGIAVIEPFWLLPELSATAVNDPLSLNFYDPTYYLLASGRRIHHSHVIKIVYGQVADILKPTYFFGGIPLTQQIFRRVYAAEKVADEAPYLAMTKRLLVADINIESLIMGDADELEKLEMLAYTRDNAGVWAKEPDQAVEQIDTALTDFDALLMTQYTLVASIGRMPSTKLMGTTPKGFNSTGEYEIKDYKQALQSIEDNEFLPLLERHYRLYTKSVYGREAMLDVGFNPIDQPTEKEQAEVNGLKATEIAALVQAQIVDEDEARERLHNDEDGNWAFLEERPADYYDDADTFGNDPDGADDPEPEPPMRGQDAEFKENEHKRDNDGKFSSGGGKSNTGESKSNAGESKSKKNEKSPAPKEWGKAYSEYSGKPDEAVNKLLQEKKGFVPNAMEKDGVGSINFVWADKKGGLKHVAEKHGEDIVKYLPKNIASGEVLRIPDDPSRIIIFNKKAQVVVSLEYKSKDIAWVVSTYKITKSRYNKYVKQLRGQDSIEYLKAVLGEKWAELI